MNNGCVYGQVTECANLSTQLAATIAKRIILIQAKERRKKIWRMYKRWLMSVSRDMVRQALREAYGISNEDPNHLL